MSRRPKTNSKLRREWTIIGATVVVALILVGALVVTRGRGGPEAVPAALPASSSAVATPQALEAPMSSTAALGPLAAPVPDETGQAAPPALPLREAAQSEHGHVPELVNVPRVTAVELLARMERGDVAVVDVRDIESYRASHIPGALHIPLSFIDGEIASLPHDKLIVAYCT